MAAAAPQLEVLGYGSGGVPEMAKQVDTSTVSFGVVRIPIGTGTFAREKVVFIHLPLETCPPIKRGKINQQKATVRKHIGDVHAELSFADKDELTLDKVLGELSHFMTSDVGTTVSLAKLKAEYEEMLAKTKSKYMSVPAAGQGASGEGPTVALTRKTAAELGTVKGQDALKAVREQMGPFNWVLFRPTEDKVSLDFVNAGSLSIPELQRSLKDDEVFYGILRLAFGAGRFRRVKWVFVVYNPERVPIVKRAKATGARASMKSKLGAVSADIEFTNKDEFTLANVINKVKRASVVDGDEVKSVEDEYSVDKFLAALAEEAKANSAFFGDTGLVVKDSSTGKRPAAEVIKEVQTPGGPLNWALFTIK